jgi:hypothetical protein
MIVRAVFCSIEGSRKKKMLALVNLNSRRHSELAGRLQREFVGISVGIFYATDLQLIDKEQEGASL